MNERSFSLLFVAPREVIEGQLRTALLEHAKQIFAAENGAQALDLLERCSAELVVIDSRSGSPQLEFLRELHSRWPSLPIVLLVQQLSLLEIAEAVTAGATDLLIEPVAIEQLTFTIRKALVVARRKAAAPPPPAVDGSIVFGRSPAMGSVRELLARVAPTSSTVLVRGESGSGKELVARSIHRLSARAAQPLIKIDCTSLPENLIESELFGYERGAFTGAVATKPGRVELANGGTLFLDEVGELPLVTQAKLLRLLQDREFERVGGIKTLRVDVRVVAATHCDLEAMVEQGAFREDLFYRLNVLPVWIAPLRARRIDIQELATHFCSSFAEAAGKPALTINDSAMRQLVAQRWPGNVRQLQNFVERLVVLSNDSEIGAAEVNAELGRPVRFATETGPAGADAAEAEANQAESVPNISVPLNQAMQAVERQILVRALKHTGGNRSAAARLLSVSRTTLYNKLGEYGLL
jgi:two-component system response regulator AtoC